MLIGPAMCMEKINRTNKPMSDSVMLLLISKMFSNILPYFLKAKTVKRNFVWRIQIGFCSECSMMK